MITGVAPPRLHSPPRGGPSVTAVQCALRSARPLRRHLLLACLQAEPQYGEGGIAHCCSWGSPFRNRRAVGSEERKGASRPPHPPAQAACQGRAGVVGGRRVGVWGRFS